MEQLVVFLQQPQCTHKRCRSAQLWRKKKVSLTVICCSQDCFFPSIFLSCDVNGGGQEKSFYHSGCFCTELKIPCICSFV